jgi:hypothetical protein
MSDSTYGDAYHHFYKYIDPDAQWFADHPERRAHIRKPVKMLHKDKQRAVFYMASCYGKCRTITHSTGRINRQSLKYPFLLLAMKP